MLSIEFALANLQLQICFCRVTDVFNQLVENIPDTVQMDPLLG